MNALVIGGTGPTGPYIVNGLLERGYDVTIMHGGFHEVEFAGPVEDLHGDVHFTETLQQTLGDRKFDLVIFMYGRLVETAQLMVGRTGRFIAVGAAGGAPGPRDPRWGPLGRPFALDEEGHLASEGSAGGLGDKIHQANERVLELHGEGHYNATIIAYPNMYGPRQMAPEDWSLVRRILDGRRQFIIADGGIKLQARAYTENAAQAVLLAVDKPNESAGELFIVTEQPLYTLRQRAELICEAMNCDMELIDMPYPLATPSHYFWSGGPSHRVRDDSKIRRVLGYKELVPVGEATVAEVEWLQANQAEFREEWEEQSDDTFDYEAEDELIRRWKQAYADLSAVEVRTKTPAHRYRHPSAPGEAWRRPERTRSYGQRQLQYY